MTPGVSAGEAVRVVGALLYVIVGLVVLRLGPRRAVNLAFAVYALAAGLLEVLAIGAVIDTLGRSNRDVLAVHLLLAVNFALFALALVYPRPLSRSQWRPALLPPVLLGVAALAMQHWSGNSWAGLGTHPYLAALFVVSVGVPSLGFLLPSRFAADGGIEEDSPQLARLAALFIIPSSIGTGAILTFMAQEGTPLWPNLGFIALYDGAVVVLWLWASACAATPSAARLARNVALFACSIPFATMLIFVTLPSLRLDVAVVFGLARILFVLALAYAVLRHQVLGLDVKARWGISRSTIAAAFVAVFFIASEAAQIVFGNGNEWVGLFAAGALVFAIAPLQRAAERLAEKAVPVASHAGVATAATRGADSFRRAVRLALRDRTLTHDEELDLATVAHDLGLTGPQATRIRLEVEREVRTGGAPASST